MSLSYQKLKPVLVRDPRTILFNEREYAVLRSGSQVTMKQFTTTSISDSSIQFSCPPPSGGIIVDRKWYLTLPIRLTFQGTVQPGQKLLNEDQDSPRAYPISSSIDTIQITINNQAVSMNMASIIQALLHFNTNEDLTERDYSMTPNALDQSQSYSDLFGAIRSPLSAYGNSLDQSVMGRGGFPFKIVQNDTNDTNAPALMTAVVDMVCTEPLFISPLYFGKGNACGFVNVNTIDINITFLGNRASACRMWSHDATSVGVATSITNASAQFSNFNGTPFSYPQFVQPKMLFTYITPNETQIIPYDVPITYPYFDIQRFPTDINQAVAANTDYPFNSNNIQLNSIPRRMYIYVRERDQELQTTPHNPDTYFSIENVSIQFQNKNGLLASASKQQLYEMSVKNHCNMNWTQWSGGPVNTPNFGSQYGTIGSILCVEFATDIGLDSIEAPGKLGQYTLQVNCLAKNISNRSINPTMYIVVVSEGSFTIEGLGKASTNIGVISSQDILYAEQSPLVNYCDVECVNGGNFFSGLKKFGRELLHEAKGVNDFLRKNKTISTISGSIPHPAAQLGSQVAKSLGYGVYAGGCAHCGDSCNCSGGVVLGAGKRGKGGVVVGGQAMSRKTLKDRLNRY